MGRSISGVRLIINQTVVEDGNEGFPILGRTIIEIGGGSRIRFGCSRLDNDLIQDTDSHQSQQLDLGDIDTEGALELGTESSGCNNASVTQAKEKRTVRRTGQGVKTIGRDQGIVRDLINTESKQVRQQADW